MLARGSIDLAPVAGSGLNVTLAAAARHARIKNSKVAVIFGGQVDLQDSQVLLSLPIGSIANAAIDAGLGLADWLLGWLEPRKGRRA